MPLPPPEVSRITSPDASGQVTVSGFALGGHSVGVLNEDTTRGVIVEATDDEGCESRCPFEARLEAEVGHTIRVWQFSSTEGSLFTSVPGD